ncbi:MAG: hypothetical protein GYB67_00350 [Chloroflexi bacterium]|nr:hypothetical protein [Chloroflexota bacterium]
MDDELMQPVQSITTTTRSLLSEETGLLTPAQIRCTEAIDKAAWEITTVFISLPEYQSAQAKTLLNFETRANLNAIIGYAELLLSGEDGPLNGDQEENVRSIRAQSRVLLARLNDRVSAG